MVVALKNAMAPFRPTLLRNESRGRMEVMQRIRPFFLSTYLEGKPSDKKVRKIQGITYTVERANHGLAHGLRQGALAKDIFDLLIYHPGANSPIANWARRKSRLDSKWGDKTEMAASFQRSGRQSECSSSSDLQRYKRYEKQDAVNFRNQMHRHPLFTHPSERRIFEEAILWSNRGTLDATRVEDLKYVRKILHTAHLLDLRRLPGFDGEKIQQDSMRKLFEVSYPFKSAFINKILYCFYRLFGLLPPPESDAMIHILWNRSGDYLEATGDRDLVCQRKDHQDRFFTQSKHPTTMVDAISKVRQKQLI